MRKSITRVAVVVALLCAVLLAFTPQLSDRLSAKFNPVIEPGPYLVPGAEIAALHKSLTLIDLHADPLMWGRDLLQRSNNGQVDLPRLQEGNMALQVFGVVTQSPKGQNFQENTDETDRLKLLVMSQHWPIKTWDSYFQRALFQAQRLRQLVADSNGELQWVRSQVELDQLLAARKAGNKTVGAFLGLEGAHGLEGQVDNVDALFSAGFRMLGMAHFIDNNMSGSAHGVERGGLSEAGKQAVKRAEALGMLIDIAHSSPAAVSDIFDIVTKPVVASHIGVQGTCDSPRNLSDEQLVRLKKNGGVAGIAMFSGAVCGNDIAATVSAIKYAIDKIGVAHVSLGGDMDGGVTTPIDVSGMYKLTAALKDAGLSDADIRAVSGENALRVFRQVLPATL